tara:strand:+ start:505 stop:1029 length:525 start_codon:yes stop_codon:yes gene_type:complete
MSNSELHLIIGPMFSGKTTELLRIANRLKSINDNILLVNYEEDKRYSSENISTHNLIQMNCTFTKNLLNLKYDSYDIICINEGQFFIDLIEFCNIYLKHNKKIYVCGLDGDINQQKFGNMIDLIPICDSVVKLNAFCKICKNGTLAPFTKRITDNKEIKLIGTNEYIAVCRNHI